MKWYKLLKDYDGKSIGEVIQLEESVAKSLLEADIVEETETPTESLMTELKASIVETVKKTVLETLKLVQPDAKEISIEVIGQAAANEDDCGYDTKNCSDYFRDVKSASQTNPHLTDRFKATLEVSHKAATGMSEGVGEEGGYLVPDQISNAIMEVYDQEADDFLGQVDSYTAVGNSIEFKVLKETSRADASRHGGVLAYWMAEADQYTATKPKFDNIRLKLHKIGIFMPVTEELLEDAGPALGTFLTRTAGKELSFQIGDAVINGSGVGKPLGILSSAALKSTTRTLASHIKAEDILNMWSVFPAKLRATSLWLINQEVEPDLMLMTIRILNAAGTDYVGGYPVYMPPGGLNDSPHGKIMGRPVMPIEYAAALGTAGDIMLVNFSQYCVLRKGGIRAAVSIHIRFDYDEEVFRFAYRIDGQPWWKTPMTPYKGTATQSPFVAVAAG